MQENSPYKLCSDTCLGLARKQVAGRLTGPGSVLAPAEASLCHAHLPAVPAGEAAEGAAEGGEGAAAGSEGAAAAGGYGTGEEPAGGSGGGGGGAGGSGAAAGEEPLERDLGGDGAEDGGWFGRSGRQDDQARQADWLGASQTACLGMLTQSSACAWALHALGPASMAPGTPGSCAAGWRLLGWSRRRPGPPCKAVIRPIVKPGIRTAGHRWGSAGR